jgi:uncharacterized protein DUF6881
MNYIRVRWLHEDRDYPILLISELDAGRWETRKVEVFADGSIGYASKDEEVGGTALGDLPVPSLQEIASDPQFLAEEITGEQFESIWVARRTASTRQV